MNTRLSLTLVFATLLSANCLIGQTNFNAIEDVILVNDKPYLVRMNLSGDILSFQKDLKNNYSSINSVKRKELSIDPVMVESTTTVPSTEPAPKAIVSSNVLSNEATNNEIASRGSNVSKEMAEKEKTQRLNYDYNFSFDHRDATLSYTSVNQLNQIADIMKENSETKANINSFFSESVDVSKILSRNRTKGIVEILKLRGIDISRITIEESNNPDWANNKVKLSIY